MAWIVSQGVVMASADLAGGRAQRRIGLTGRDTFDGAFVIQDCRWIHTFRMRFELDVAYLDATGTVVKTVRMHRHRLGAPVWRANTVVEAEAGAFARWGLHVGDVIEIRS